MDRTRLSWMVGCLAALGAWAPALDDVTGQRLMQAIDARGARYADVAKQIWR